MGKSSHGTTSRDTSMLDGLIIDGSRGRYRVETDDGVLLCTIRGKLRKELEFPESQSTRKGVKKVTVRQSDPVSIGDRVLVQPVDAANGVIMEITARSGAFTRDDPDQTRHKQHLTSVSGLDQLVLVFAVRDPEPHLRMLDRMLVTAEVNQLAAIICFNKVDLGVPAWLTDRMPVYERIGYPVLTTSIETFDGIDVLRERLSGKVSAFVGPSGVGKSSLLNAIQPGLAQQVGRIGITTHKGRHTTTGSRLISLDGDDGGRVADTAGIRMLGLNPQTIRRLPQYFPEFEPYQGQCRMNDCGHIHEPQCAVKAALATGVIDADRYDSYLRMRTGQTLDDLDLDIDEDL